MKLKKIASLMLAGIMAVSMLAGCGEGKDNTNPPASSTPATPSVVSTIESAIKAENSDLIISVSENRALATAMDKYNEDYATKYQALSESDIRDNVLKKVFPSANLDSGKVLLGNTAVLETSVTAGGTEYRYVVISKGADVSASDNLTLAANTIAAELKDLDNVFVNSSKANLYNDYTLYVYEGSMVNNSNKDVPYVIAVLITKTSANV